MTTFFNVCGKLDPSVGEDGIDINIKNLERFQTFSDITE